MPDPTGPADTAPGALADRLLAALRRMLRPLIALLIRCGVTFPVVAELIRGLYVEVAVRDLLPDARARTDSRVSLMTGVHRKEIRRLRALVPADLPVPAAVTVSSQVMARWLSAPGYQDASGVPLDLPRAGPAGTRSFESLVTAVTTDVRPRAVLDDWLSQGFASQLPDERLRLDVAAYLPRPGQAEQVYYFARNLADHIAASCANVLATGQPPFVDRSVHYDRLNADTARRMEAAARTAALAALLEVNRTAIALTDDQASTEADRHRVNFGVYVYVDEAPPSAPADASRPGAAA